MAFVSAYSFGVLHLIIERVMSLTLADLSSADAVQAALDEFVRSGQKTFLSQHGFGRASGYLVRDPKTGLWADSKAIVGVALSFQFPGQPGLNASAFSGGMATVVRKLESLGFEVQSLADLEGGPWTREEVELIVADYRLFDFRRSPRFFELAGPIEQHCQLDPTTYRAGFG